MNVTIGNAVCAAMCAAFLILTAGGCADRAGERLAHPGDTAVAPAVIAKTLWSADAEDRDFGLAFEANRRGVPFLVAFDLEDLENGRERQQRY